MVMVNFDYLTAFSTIELNLYCSKNMGVWAPLDLTPDHILALKWLCIGAAVLASIGLFTRAAYWVVFISFMLLNMYALKFCYWNHLYMPLHIPILLWGLLDKDSSYRFERWIFRKKKELTSEKEERAIFFIKCNRVFFALVFFATGLNKIIYGGVDWIFSSSLQNILFLQNFAQAHAGTNPYFLAINQWVIDHPYLCMFLAFETVFLEFIAPIALFSKRWSIYILIQLALMLIGFLILMYIDFLVWFLLFLFWLPFKSTTPTFKFLCKPSPGPS